MKFLKFAFLLLFLLATQLSFSLMNENDDPKNSVVSDAEMLNSSTLYTSLQLSSCGLSYDAFHLALKGMKRLADAGRVLQTNIITIADLSQSSCKKRLYVIDLENQRILFQTYVAHGRNSGEEYAQLFSNQLSSYKTSLGFYTTLETYNGDHGLSLRLNGEEPGINDQALDRGIVIHGADYVNADFIRQNQRLGRSQGCPAIPVNLSTSIINILKGGSCLFLYSQDSAYLSGSELLSD